MVEFNIYLYSNPIHVNANWQGQCLPQETLFSNLLFQSEYLCLSLGFQTLYFQMGFKSTQTPSADSCLFLDIAHRDAQGFGHAFSVSLIGLETVADVTNLDLPGRVTHSAGSVLKEGLLLLGTH